MCLATRMPAEGRATTFDMGAKIVHISPARDDMPVWAGTDCWTIQPNSDAGLMLELAGEIAQAGQQD